MTNGGLAIENSFNRFAELYFGRQPGCNSLESIDQRLKLSVSAQQLEQLDMVAH